MSLPTTYPTLADTGAALASHGGSLDEGLTAAAAGVTKDNKQPSSRWVATRTATGAATVADGGHLASKQVTPARPLARDVAGVDCASPVLVAALGDPTSSYQPAHISASLGGAPPFVSVPVAHRGRGPSSASSAPMTRAVAPHGGPSAHAPAVAEKPMLLRPCRRSAMSPWASLCDTSSEEGVRNSLPHSLSHNTNAHAATTVGASRVRTRQVGGAARIFSPFATPLTAQVHNTAAGTYHPLHGTAAAHDTEPDAHAAASHAAPVDLTTIKAFGAMRYPLANSVGSRGAVLEPEVSDACTTIAAAVPLFVSPLRRAQLVERRQAEEMAQRTRQRVLEYLDGQVPPAEQSTAASLSLSAPSTPFTRTTLLSVGGGGAGGLRDPSFYVSRLSSPAPQAPGSLPRDLSSAVHLGVGATSSPHANSFTGQPFAARTQGELPRRSPSFTTLCSAQSDSAPTHGLCGTRCPLCHELVHFCPHGVSVDPADGAQDKAARHVSTLLHARGGGADRAARRRGGRVGAPLAAAPSGSAASASEAATIDDVVSRCDESVQHCKRLLVPLAGRRLANDEERL